MFKRFRSSRTGLWVSRAEADANRDTTVSEQVDGNRLTITFEHHGSHVDVYVHNRDGRFPDEVTNHFQDATYARALRSLGAVLDSEADA